MSSMANHDGTVSESHLGLVTEKIAAAMTDYNATGGWPPVSE